MAVEMAERLGASVRTHAEESYPHECCGFLLGREISGVKRVSEVRRAGNRRDDSPRNRYQIAPEEFLAIERETRAGDLVVLGFYHSHPDVPAVPSEYDREHAWPWYTYLIVPVARGHAGAPRAWVLKDPERIFEEEPLLEMEEE